MRERERAREGPRVVKKKNEMKEWKEIGFIVRGGPVREGESRSAFPDHYQASLPLGSEI